MDRDTLVCECSKCGNIQKMQFLWENAKTNCDAYSPYTIDFKCGGLLKYYYENDQTRFYRVLSCGGVLEYKSEKFLCPSRYPQPMTVGIKPKQT